MSCPNAIDPPADAVTCGGTGLIPWTVDGDEHLVPCGWCWRAAGYDGPLVPQIPHLVRWTVALDAVLDEPAQPVLFGEEGRGREFDRLCDKVRRAGVSDPLRDAWLAWIRRHTADIGGAA